MRKEELYGTGGIDSILCNTIKDFEYMKSKSTNLYIKFKLWLLIRKAKKVLTK